MRPLRALYRVLIVAAVLSARVDEVRAEDAVGSTLIRAKPAVVFVVAGSDNGPQSASGFVAQSASTSSTIVTSDSILEFATSVDVIFDGNERERFPARIVSRDRLADIATLHVDTGNRRILTLESPASMREHEPLVIVGHPRADILMFRDIDDASLQLKGSVGVMESHQPADSMLKIDAASYAGDAGAPIIAAESGRVIAIVRAAPSEPIGGNVPTRSMIYGSSSESVAALLGLTVPPAPNFRPATVATTQTAHAVPSAAPTVTPGPREPASSPALSWHGSSLLCGMFGAKIVATDHALSIAARSAYEAGVSDSRVLSGTKARYGSAFKEVEDDFLVIDEEFHAGMDSVTDAAIDVDKISIPEEQAMAQNSVDWLTDQLKFVNAYGQVALQFERTVNAKNRNASLARLNEALAALPSSSRSSTKANVSCYGRNCYGSATTYTTIDNTSVVAQQRAANLQLESLHQARSVEDLMPAFQAYTNEVDDLRYQMRIGRAHWLEICPNLEFSPMSGG